MPATTHGHTRNRVASKTYGIWATMISRCHNPNFEKYKSYGARGITVCKKWRKFEGFLADMGEVPKGLTLERKDVNKGYTKSNCRWATTKEQSKNRTDNRNFLLNGKKFCLVDLAKLVGIPRQTIYGRLRTGMSIEEAITKPVRSTGKRSRAKLKKLPAR
jgi:hypothetical protein